MLRISLRIGTALRAVVFSRGLSPALPPKEYVGAPFAFAQGKEVPRLQPAGKLRADRLCRT